MSTKPNTPPIEQIGALFALHTYNTSYLFRVAPSGHLEHLHYGASISCNKHTESALAQRPRYSPGCSVQYSPDFTQISLEQLRTELGTLGKGDLGEPLLDLHFADGNRTVDFAYQSAHMTLSETYRVTEPPHPDFTLPIVSDAIPSTTTTTYLAQNQHATPPNLGALPTAYDADATLAITLVERQNPTLTLTLYYNIFSACDVMTRSMTLTNGTDSPIEIERFGSSQLDFYDTDFTFSTFHGGWSDEMHRCDTRLNGGTVLAESRGGASSNHTNPLTLLTRTGVTETMGEVYGSNLIYSGNHRTIAHTGAYGKLRVQVGISPEGFSYTLPHGDSFHAPEAVLSHTLRGYDGMSQNMHKFVQHHVVRGTWQHKERPVLLNSWEACYMDFTEAKLLKLAKAGKSCGVELFVLDDGWFGTRDDDTQSLGDWQVNTKKLPNGLHGLAEKINALGMQFGIWVEPEMLNVNSDLYRAHPDWALAHPTRPHSEGRQQRILDLTNPAVRTYLKETLCVLLESAHIEYVKWDMNRVMSDAFSPYLLSSQQGEVPHRYMLGLYELLAYLTEKFPDILFESCASGGNRADLGMLCYMPQVWASDNTDAVSRARIQTGYSFGYPMSVLGCHVSASPNHQTLRETPLHSRFAIASCGLLGYELDFLALSAKEKADITAQITLYKKLRPWLQYASYHRIQNGDATPPIAGLGMAQTHSGAPQLPRYQWCAVSADQKHALGVEFQLLHNMENAPERFRMRGLLPQEDYHFYNIPQKVDIRPFGSLMNQVSPVPVKVGGLLHQLAAQFVHLDGETENCVLSGSALEHIGAATAPMFMGNGFDHQVKYLPDFGARMYFAEHTQPLNMLAELLKEPDFEIEQTS